MRDPRPTAAAGKLLLAALLVALVPPACSRTTGSVEGRTSIAGVPSGGAEVRFFVREGEERSGTPFATGSSGADGAFRKELPAGTYYVTAVVSVREGGRDRTYKGEHPGNPVRVEAGRRVAGVDVPMAEMSGMGFVPQEGTGVTGRVESRGRPAEGAYVYAYPEGAGTARGPSFVAYAKADRSGRFALALREGRFRIVARRKGGENETGAMREKGESGGAEGVPVDLRAGTTRDVGTIVLHRSDEDRRKRRAPAGGQDEPRANIAGTVVRDDGAPAEGVRVMAYADHRMIGRPFAISGKTGEDGRFRLGLPRAGTFYLGARSDLGGPLSPGEWVGTYDGSPDHSIRVEEGESRDGVRIRVVEKW